MNWTVWPIQIIEQVSAWTQPVPHSPLLPLPTPPTYTPYFGCAKDSSLFSASQAPHIKLCATNERQNIEPSRNCNMYQSTIYYVQFVSRLGNQEDFLVSLCLRSEEKRGIEIYTQVISATSPIWQTFHPFSKLHAVSCFPKGSVGSHKSFGLRLYGRISQPRVLNPTAPNGSLL